MRKVLLYLAVAAVAVACKNEKDDNTAVAPNLTVNGVTWADCHVDGNQQFAARPDMYTKFYQWNRSKAWDADSLTVTGWVGYPDFVDTASTWTVNPCPAGWRLPTIAEYVALDSVSGGYYSSGEYIGGTWADANTRGNAVAGRFYGPNHVTASLPDNMEGAVFFPASGYRSYTNGALAYQGVLGLGWSSTQVSSTSGYDLVFNSAVGGPADGNSKAFGFPVRCVR
jgi:uncharacterized protein (TIGR02145 family)